MKEKAEPEHKGEKASQWWLPCSIFTVPAVISPGDSFSEKNDLTK